MPPYDSQAPCVVLATLFFISAHQVRRTRDSSFYLANGEMEKLELKEQLDGGQGQAKARPQIKDTVSRMNSSLLEQCSLCLAPWAKGRKPARLSELLQGAWSGVAKTLFIHPFIHCVSPCLLRTDHVLSQMSSSHSKVVGKGTGRA